jgi:hypothetical protein
MLVHLILDKETKSSYYPEIETYKQEVCSPYNQLGTSGEKTKIGINYEIQLVLVFYLLHQV